MTMQDAINELYERREKARQMGGEKRVAKQHAWSAYRTGEVDKLLNPSSFMELGLLGHAIFRITERKTIWVLSG